MTTSSPAVCSPTRLFRVERGRPGLEELAAVAAVLLARATAAPAESSVPVRRTVGWRRPERRAVFESPRAWRNATG
ncbi:acyl-CoA carboxylase epsilon subunit [Streptomyces sp. NPDC059906]|uniref:acyl-CoA carboxylase epsilon subunit n=1 Tax=Streptomyces sp. NPDC059906 TaxID=3346997 RepID=UPI003653D4BA